MSATVIKIENPGGQDSGDWGWEPLGSDDEEPENAVAVILTTTGCVDNHEDEGKDSSVVKGGNPSEKHLMSKKAGSFSNRPIRGIVSSPSFQELEKAIAGATLNLASNDSGDVHENRTLVSSGSGTFPSRLSSTNLTQQKVHQQRMRQQHQHQNLRYPMQSSQNSRSPTGNSYSTGSASSYLQPMPSPLPAKVELSPFINESESRAIILFHSVHVSTAEIRNACSKYGVLYYIRPEFHNRGVTLISYFDLRSATAAKACIAEDLGRIAEASAHYSVMLHAANGNSEEFRLVVRNLPSLGCGETEVQSIFARYGQLRSIQKVFADDIVPDNNERDSSGNDGNRPGSDIGKETTDRGAYTVEYFNIQDARLAVSELSATSAQLWNADVTVMFASLEERKQQLCRQLLATLSRWRTDMAAVANYNMSLQAHQQHARQYGSLQMPLPMGMGGIGSMVPVSLQHPQVLHMGLHPTYGGMNLTGLMGSGYATGMAHSGHSESHLGGQYFDHAAQQHAHLQHLHQQQREQMAAASGGTTMLYSSPQSVPAYPLSPMRSALMPVASLSNPNLFNFGLLAAQAEAQMRQQQEQQHHHQGGDDVAMSHIDHITGSAGSQLQASPANSGNRGITPPHHNGAHSTGNQQFAYGGNQQRLGVPLHHHQQQHSGGMIGQSYVSGGGVFNGSAYPSPVSNGSQQVPGRRGKGSNGGNGALYSGNGAGVGGGSNNQIDADFAVDLKRISEDLENRTTIMVYNNSFIS